MTSLDLPRAQVDVVLAALVQYCNACHADVRSATPGTKYARHCEARLLAARDTRLAVERQTREHLKAVA